MYATDRERWTAIAERDRKADGAFVYAVVTTGVYCRPGCPSRLPRQANVRFFPNGQEAERAGFRACKRCRPDKPALAARHADIVAAACRMIEEADEVPSLESLAEASGLSRFHFHRIFKAVTGVTPKAYADGHRAARLRDGLATEGSVTEALYGAGFNSSGRFYAASADLLGMAPTVYRAGGDGLTIRFGTGDCSLGKVLVAATAKGICAISLGDDPDGLASELKVRFPKADLIAGDDSFEAWVARVVAFVEAPKIGLDLPLDLRGTVFQLRVWQALREIPPGATVSYTKLANHLGMPKAARAVARACASNPAAVAVPCHRVIRQDGNLSGYRWGIERKRALLDREKT